MHELNSLSSACTTRKSKNYPNEFSAFTLLYYPYTEMARKNHRAWNILRTALLWARKGGVFKRRLMVELRVFPQYLKSLAQGHTTRTQLHHGERQLFFDKTPIFHVKMHRPVRFNIPCITPQVDFDYDFDVDEYEYDDGGRKSFLKGGEEEEYKERTPEEEKEIDLRAEESIAKFYEQMKIQRQISRLQYNDMDKQGLKLIIS